SQQHRQPHGGGQQRQQGGGQGGRRGGGRGRNRRGGRRSQPFVGPMDHSYRNGQEVNGNVADLRQPTGPLTPRYYSEPQAATNGPVAPSRDDGPARMFAFIEDLFFLAKINETARKLGTKVEFVKSPDPILDRGGDDVPEDQRPQLVMIDLNNPNF